MCLAVYIHYTYTYVPVGEKERGGGGGGGESGMLTTITGIIDVHTVFT